MNRSRTLPHATSSAKEIATQAADLLAAVDVADGVRLLGVGVSGLSEFSQQDLLADLLDDPDEPLETGEPSDPGADVPVGVLAGGSVQPYGPPAHPGWRPGQDVVHAEHGTGWVQGSGVGRVTVRFEGPHTPVGRVRTFAEQDPDLEPADPPVFDPDLAAASEAVRA